MSAGRDEPYRYLVKILKADPDRARKVAAEHTRDASGRCQVCRAGGDSSGRTFGCVLGSAAREALSDT